MRVTFIVVSLLLLLGVGTYLSLKQLGPSSEPAVSVRVSADRMNHSSPGVSRAEAMQVEVVAQLNYSLLPEASGLGVSGIDPQRLWLINDSGGRSELVALDLDSGKFRRVDVRDTSNRDWEDLEVFDYRGTSWVVIADVGDNEARRKRVALYFLPEPSAKDRRVSVSATIKLSYPDGPRDVEGVAVDPQSNTLYLLSKREPYPRLYALILPELEAGETYQMQPQLLGEVRSIPAPTADDLQKFPMYGQNRSRPTGMSHVPNGSGIALLTYGKAYFAALDGDRDWLAALNDSLCPIPRPDLEQAESIAADGQGRIYITSEGKKAPVLRLLPRSECLLVGNPG